MSQNCKVKIDTLKAKKEKLAKLESLIAVDLDEMTRYIKDFEYYTEYIEDDIEILRQEVKELSDNRIASIKGSIEKTKGIIQSLLAELRKKYPDCYFGLYATTTGFSVAKEKQETDIELRFEYLDKTT